MFCFVFLYSGLTITVYDCDDDFKVQFPKARKEDLFFSNKDLMFSQVMMKAEIVKRVYGYDATELLGNKQNYIAKNSRGYRVFKYEWIPLEPMLLHSGYMGQNTVKVDDIKEALTNVANNYENNHLEKHGGKYSVIEEIYVGNKTLEKGNGDAKQATIAFNEELKERDDIPVGKPLTNKVHCSFAVLSMFSHMNVRKQKIDKKLVLSVVSHTQPKVNHRATEEHRITGGVDSAGRPVPGILCTAYGKKGTEEYTFGKNDATILAYSNKLLKDVKVIADEKGNRALANTKKIEGKFDMDAVCPVVESVVLMKSHPVYSAEPTMGYMGKREYQEINNLCIALFDKEIWCYFDLEHELFKKMSWNDRVICLVGGLLNMIHREFGGFAKEKEIWR